MIETRAAVAQARQADLALDRHAGVVGDLLARAGQQVEEGRLAAVRIADQRDAPERRLVRGVQGVRHGASSRGRPLAAAGVRLARRRPRCTAPRAGAARTSSRRSAPRAARARPGRGAAAAPARPAGSRARRGGAGRRRRSRATPRRRAATVARAPSASWFRQQGGRAGSWSQAARGARRSHMRMRLSLIWHPWPPRQRSALRGHIRSRSPRLSPRLSGCHVANRNDYQSIVRPAAARLASPKPMKSDPKSSTISGAAQERADRDQPVLPALPDAQALGPRQAGEEGIRGVDRRDEARRQADGAHLHARRPAQPAGPRQAADRRERARDPVAATCSPRPARRRRSRTASPIARRCATTSRATCCRRSWTTPRSTSTCSRPRSTCSPRSASELPAIADGRRRLTPAAPSKGHRHDRLRLPPRLGPRHPPCRRRRRASASSACSSSSAWRRSAAAAPTARRACCATPAPRHGAPAAHAAVNAAGRRAAWPEPAGRAPYNPAPLRTSRRRAAGAGLPCSTSPCCARTCAQVVARLETRKSPQPFLDVDRFSALEAERKALQTRTEELQARRNALSQADRQAQGPGRRRRARRWPRSAAIGAELERSAERLEAIQAELHDAC